MSKLLKVGGIAVAAVLVLVIAGVVLLWSNLNDVVKATVETVGSEVTGTDVRLAEVDISLTDGHGSLRGFQVLNPQGFSRDDAFAFDEIGITLDVATVFDDPVVVKEVVVDRPRIIYELAERGGNLETIQGNVEKNSGGGSGTGGSEGSGSGSSSGSSSEGPAIVIENLIFRNGEVSVAASRFLDRKITTPLPTLHLRDLGKEQGGADPATIASQTMDELYRSAIKAVGSANIDLDGLRRGLEGAGAAAEQRARDALNQAGDTADEAGKAIEKGLDDAGETLKNLLD